MQKKSRGPYPVAITTTEMQQKVLEQIANSRRSSHAHVLRAKVVLGAKEGKRNQRIADEQKCSRGLVRRWRERWGTNQPRLAQAEADVTEAGYRKLIEASLSDEERSGCPNTFTAEQLCQIIAVAVQAPKEYGCPVTHWTARELAHVLVEQDIVSSISTRHVGRFLKGMRPETASVSILTQ